MVHLTPIEETVAGQEWIQEGMQRGMVQAMQGDLLEVLEARFGQAPDTVRSAVFRLAERDKLKALLRRAASAESLAAFERSLPRSD